MNKITKGDRRRVEVISRSNLLGKEIDVYVSTETPYFRASDIVQWIDVTSPSVLVQRIDQEEVTVLNLGDRSGETLFLTEDGLYEILMDGKGSQKSAALQYIRNKKKEKSANN